MSMGSTYLRKDGRWEARLSLGTINGKRQSKSFYGTSREEAERKLFSATLTGGNTVITEMTVRELCVEWLMISRNRVKASTLANYRMKMEKHIIPSFGDIMCCDLTARTAYDFMQRKLDSGLSPRYVTDIMVLLKSVFKYARREYRIIDPFDGIAMPKCPKPEVRLLTAIEQKRLRSYINSTPSLVNLGVTLALGMGLRVGEVCGLMWQDIDFQKRILSVKRTVQRVAVQGGSRKTAVIVSSPKSESSAREIPIPAGVFSMLKKFRSNADHYIISDSESPVEPRKMQYQFAWILKNVNLPSVKFHSLRHCFASRAVEQGVDIKTLSELLGHSRVEVTMNLYIHSSLDRKRKCMELMKWVV